MTSINAEGQRNVATADDAGDGALPSAHTPLLGGGQGMDSYARKCLNIIDSVVGVGVLGMSYAFRQAGWLGGSMAVTFVGLACFYSMMLIVKSKRKVENDGNYNIHSYSDLGFVAFGKPGHLVVDLVSVLYAGGYCVAYLIFIGENLASIFTGIDNGFKLELKSMAFPQGVLGFGSKRFGLNWKAKAVYVWIVLPFQIWLPSIPFLASNPFLRRVVVSFMMFADVPHVAAMFAVMINDGLQLDRCGIQNVDTFTGWSSLPFAVGVAIVVAGDHRLAIPIKVNMEDRIYRSKFSIIFASLGYFAFGDETKDIITLNLGTRWQTTVIKVAVCLGLFFTLPVTLYPVHEIMERRFRSNRPSFFLRTVTVLAIAWMAVSFPYFGDFLFLMGSSVCCVRSFLFPPLFHLRIYAGNLQWWEIVVDSSFIVFGLCFGCWGTWSAVQSWS